MDAYKIDTYAYICERIHSIHCNVAKDASIPISVLAGDRLPTSDLFIGLFQFFCKSMARRRQVRFID